MTEIKKQKVMYCKHCGQKISEDSVFCKYCGAKQEGSKLESSMSPIIQRMNTLWKEHTLVMITYGLWLTIHGLLYICATAVAYDDAQVQLYPFAAWHDEYFDLALYDITDLFVYTIAIPIFILFLIKNVKSLNWYIAIAIYESLMFLGFMDETGKFSWIIWFILSIVAPTLIILYYKKKNNNKDNPNK